MYDSSTPQVLATAKYRGFKLEKNHANYIVCRFFSCGFPTFYSFYDLLIR